MEFGPFIILATSLLALPAVRLVSSVQEMHGEAALLIVGIVALTAICLLNFVAIRYFTNLSEPTWLLVVFTLGTFSSAVDIVTALEADGLVSGFMAMYLRKGEPYLGTPFGALICYWDGTVHYLLYAVMLSAISFKKDYRFAGLYWAGSIGHSMFVLIPGAVIGKFGVRWSVLLNIPYLIIPYCSAAHFLNKRPALTSSHGSNDKAPSVRNGAGHSSLDNGTKERIQNGNVSKSLIKRPFDLILVVSLIVSLLIALFRGFIPNLIKRLFDLILVVSLIVSLLIALFRGFAVMGCSHDLAKNYIKYYEPYLNDPIAFPKVQMLVYFYYFVPFYIMAIYALIYNTESTNHWLTDWSLLFAGAAAQAQFPHIIAPFYSTTAPEFRIPAAGLSVFLLINLFLLIQPQIFAARCLWKHLSSKSASHRDLKKKAN